MEIWTISIRTVLIYFSVYLFLRLMGKREIGKLSLFDLVISIMIAEIAVFVLEDHKKPIVHGLLPMGILVAIQMLLAYISLKSQTIRRLLDGNPSTIIRNGKLNWKEMRKQKYNLDDLIVQLRENKVTNLADVEFAILETTGRLSVIEKRHLGKGNEVPPETGNHANVNEDGKMQQQTDKLADTMSNDPKVRYEGLPIPLIMDGKVIDENLETIGKTRFWLKNKIQEKGISDFKQVFICTYDHKGNMFIDRK